MPWGWRLLCLWPGLARLWLRGDFYALGLAVFYSILLNLALVSSLIWPAYLGSQFLLVTWPFLAALWLVSAWISWRGMPQWLQIGHKFAAPAELRIDTLFNQAQREYLRCHWAEARELLERRLRVRPRDVESRLLLASIFRRVGRFQLAHDELKVLEGMDEARLWNLELARERERLLRSKGEQTENLLPVDDLAEVSARELHQGTGENSSLTEQIAVESAESEATRSSDSIGTGSASVDFVEGVNSLAGQVAAGLPGNLQAGLLEDGGDVNASPNGQRRRAA
jgi:hypothetical protein